MLVQRVDINRFEAMPCARVEVKHQRPGRDEDRHQQPRGDERMAGEDQSAAARMSSHVLHNAEEEFAQMGAECAQDKKNKDDNKYAVLIRSYLYASVAPYVAEFSAVQPQTCATS